MLDTSRPMAKAFTGDYAMTIRELPPIELLRKLLRYEPETGKLFWRERTPDMFKAGKRNADHNCAVWNSRFAGKEFGSLDKRQYRWGSLLGVQCVSAHSIVFAIANKRWPASGIDHIDGDPENNRHCNLREASQSMNGRNCKLSLNNTSGAKGVSFDKKAKMWRAYATVNRKRKNLGSFKDKESAISARVSFERDNMFTCRWLDEK